MSRFISIIIAIVAILAITAQAFVTPGQQNAVSVSQRTPIATSKTAAFIFGKKNEDLSDIESRDMTREEMVELNKKNEDIMNMELQAMTGFSLVLSLPILYLCWVAFFSD
eukprot:CAMPEP_0202451494 /NCGR_PEP_ID=MMETSP1360-20130828/9916_1 /ASSEMBLY_ACC=CAM_ASM_000848 /TAXON_ID=515479 /ORGANISM="Licmophora paradoxa, Strain CCMP2313" /LENGTH=109 /DNA_ID=CAMNT_0049070077 /DNA_START=125 /DNA_END=454 /DNA_ORIENTATION=-